MKRDFRWWIVTVTCDVVDTAKFCDCVLETSEVDIQAWYCIVEIGWNWHWRWDCEPVEPFSFSSLPCSWKQWIHCKKGTNNEQLQPGRLHEGGGKNKYQGLHSCLFFQNFFPLSFSQCWDSHQSFCGRLASKFYARPTPSVNLPLRYIDMSW